MACPTCNHTMQSVGEIELGWRIYWCQRCGTLKTKGAIPEHEAPMLVERVRRFRNICNGGDGLNAEQASLWHRLGIGESIEREAEPKVAKQ